MLIVRTFQTQVQEFEDLFTPMPGPSRANWHSNDTLFVVFFGINDMVSLMLLTRICANWQGRMNVS